MANETAKIKPTVQDRIRGVRGVDLGCGNAPIFREVVGIDEAFERAAKTTETGIIRSSVLAYIQKQSANQLDWIFSSHYLEHEPRWREVLTECQRVLQPNGDLFLYLPDKDVYIGSNGKDPNPGHVNHWNLTTFLCDFMAAFAGRFEVILAEARNTTPCGHHFTGNGNTEHPSCAIWEYSFFVHARRAS